MEKITGKVEISRHGPGHVAFTLYPPLTLYGPVSETFFISREEFLVLMDKLTPKSSVYCTCFGENHINGRHGSIVVLTRREDNVVVEIYVRGYNVTLDIEVGPGQKLIERGYYQSGHVLPFFEVEYRELQEIEKNLKQKGE